MLGMLSGAGHTQIDLGKQNTRPQASDPGSNMPPLGPNVPASIAAKQERARNEERQKRLKADTDRLLTLATELHEDVAKTDKNVLSLDVVRRAEEIEKLARAVKDRMKG